MYHCIFNKIGNSDVWWVKLSRVGRAYGIDCKDFVMWNDYRNALFALLMFCRPIKFLDNNLTVTSLTVIIITSIPVIKCIIK